jgi:hypothetical protein
MQNKPNLPDAQINITPFYTVDYENKSNWKLGENKPNTNPIKANTNPIPEMSKMNVTSVLTKDYENERLRDAGKTKPIQTQSNPTCRGVASGEAGANPTGLPNTSPKKVLIPLAWPIK